MANWCLSGRHIKLLLMLQVVNIRKKLPGMKAVFHYYVSINGDFSGDFSQRVKSCIFTF